jgi:hypothetical protein
MRRIGRHGARVDRRLDTHEAVIVDGAMSRRPTCAALHPAVDPLRDGVRLSLERVARRADMDAAAGARASVLALYDVRELVREQLLALARLGGERAGREEDVVAHRERARTDRTCGGIRDGIGMHANPHERCP